jgi:hypothetical protein
MLFSVRRYVPFVKERRISSSLSLLDFGTAIWHNPKRIALWGRKRTRREEGAEKEAAPFIETEFSIQRRIVPLEETEVQEKAIAETGTEAVTRTADVLLLFLSGPSALGVSDIARLCRAGCH